MNYKGLKQDLWNLNSKLIEKFLQFKLNSKTFIIQDKNFEFIREKWNHEKDNE